VFFSICRCTIITLLIPTFDLTKHASVKTAAAGVQRTATPLTARYRFMGLWHAGIRIPSRQYGMSKTPKPQFTWPSRMPPLLLVFASNTQISFVQIHTLLQLRSRNRLPGGNLGKGGIGCLRQKEGRLGDARYIWVLPKPRKPRFKFF